MDPESREASMRQIINGERKGHVIIFFAISHEDNECVTSAGILRKAIFIDVEISVSKRINLTSR